jgi:hypothetical protein
MGDTGRDLRSDVLNERSAEGHIEDLDAAANGEHRNSPRLRFLDESCFGRIARGVDGAYFFVALFPVASGIDVLTAGEHETGNRIEHRGRCRGTRQWRNDEWYEPCVFEGCYVSGGKPDTTGIAIGADASGNSNCAGWNRLARGRHE